MTDVPRTSPEFSLNHQFFCWSPKSPLKVPWRSKTLLPLGDLQGTYPERRAPAGYADVYILVKGTIAITGAGDDAAVRKADERNNGAIFKNLR